MFVNGRPLTEDQVIDPLVDPDPLMESTDRSSFTRSSMYTQQDISNDQLLNDVDFQEYKVGLLLQGGTLPIK